MNSQLESSELLLREENRGDTDEQQVHVDPLIARLLPSHNPNAGDRARAWEEWYAQVGEASVLAFIKTMNNSGEQDVDILQDAMMTAYSCVERGHYKPCGGIPFTAYVKGIARNKIREARRRRHPRYIEETVLGLHESVESDPDKAAWCVPETVVERQEEQHALQWGIGRLSHNRQQVLVHYLQGHSTPEIAAALHISEDLVRQHKSRSVRSLRRLLCKSY